MKRQILFGVLAGLMLAGPVSATMVRQEWWYDCANTRQAIIDYLVDLADPVPEPDYEEVQDASEFSGSRDQYVAKFYGWVTVPETGTYQFHYACDDYGMLYVSQDEEMANAVEVAYVDGWCAVDEWNKYPDTQHSDPMQLVAGQTMAVMAFFNEEGGGDNMDIGWTGPGLSSDITNPTYLTDYITHIPPTPTKAKNPSPEVGATDLPRDTDMSWTAGRHAATHDVYLGTSMEDVNTASRADPMDVLVSQGQADATYDPGYLEFGQTYYWRVDEVNAAPDNTIFKGKVWEFSIEPFAYPAEGVIATTDATSDEGVSLENVVNGSGLNTAGEHSIESMDAWVTAAGNPLPVVVDFELPQVCKLDEMLVWNYNNQFEPMLGFGCKDVTIEYSADGAEWTLLGDVVFTQATALEDYTANTTIDFGGAAVKYVRLTINSGYGPLGQVGLSELQFMYVPANAREPQPADGAADVSVATALDWRAGREAVSHEVYLGTDPDALTLAGTADTPTYTPGPLDMETAYYWQIVEVNEADEISTWPGAVWSFTTQAFLVVDDFESYDNEDNPIYGTWTDGWINGTGSTVGHLIEPFAEQTIVNSGTQSMPFFYDNAGVDTAEAELDLNQDWTASGIQSLALYFYGDAANSEGQLYVKINNTKIDYDGPAVNITRPSWQLWTIDLSTVGGNLSGVTSFTIGVESAGAAGVLYIDDIRLYPEVLESTLPDITSAGDTVQGVPNDGDWPSGEEPPNAIDDDATTKYLHRKGGSETTGFQVEPMVGATIVTGLTFTSANDDYGRDPTSFELYGSNDSIDGPYELIAAGEIVDFSQDDLWPRYTKTETPIEFENTVAYTYYQVLFPTVDRPGNDGLMQIAEVELLGEVVQ